MTTVQSPAGDAITIPSTDGPTPIPSNVPPTTAATSASTAVVWTSLPTAGVALGAPMTIEYKILDVVAFQNPELSLVLCQTGATDDAITSDNTWSVSGINCDTAGDKSECALNSDNEGTTNITLYPGSKFSTQNLNNFFFCFAYSPSIAATPGKTGLVLNDLVCEYSSPYFDVTPDTHRSAKRAAQVPASRAIRRASSPGQVPENLPIKQNIPIINAGPDGAAGVAGVVSTTAIPNQSVVTVSIPPTATITPSATPSALSASGSSSSTGLSTGAKAGIAIGAVLGVIGLTLLIFCLVRRSRSRGPGNRHVMLSNSPPLDMPRSMDNLTEKTTRSYPNMIVPEAGQTTQRLYSDQQVDEEDLEPHALSIYGAPEQARHISSLLAPPVSHSRSSSQSQSHDRDREAEVTRTFSTVSALSPRSVHSGHSNSSPDDDDSFNEPFHDHHTPVYGDARHTPVTQVSSSREAVAVLLSEPGMTDEDFARLEEEERRIDAAIAAAERAHRSK
ncbi:hypothetical protein B7463_g1119, partial [Scytalidium lignicola]